MPTRELAVQVAQVAFRLLRKPSMPPKDARKRKNCSSQSAAPDSAQSITGVDVEPIESAANATQSRAIPLSISVFISGKQTRQENIASFLRDGIASSFPANTIQCHCVSVLIPLISKMFSMKTFLDPYPQYRRQHPHLYARSPRVASVGGHSGPEREGALGSRPHCQWS